MSAPVEVGQRRRWNATGLEFTVVAVDGDACWIRCDDGARITHTTTFVEAETTVVAPRPEWANTVPTLYVWFNAVGGVTAADKGRPVTPVTQGRWSVRVNIDHDTWEWHQ